MATTARNLLKNYSFVFKVVELILAFASIAILSELKEYAVPRWLWLTYCFDSITYTAILSTIIFAYIIDTKHEFMEFTYCILGMIFYLIGGISGIFRALIYEAEHELTLGLLLIVSSVPMMIETNLKIFSADKNQRQEN